jgi:hypothetical protein
MSVVFARRARPGWDVWGKEVAKALEQVDGAGRLIAESPSRVVSAGSGRTRTSEPRKTAQRHGSGRARRRSSCLEAVFRRCHGGLKYETRREGGLAYRLEAGKFGDVAIPNFLQIESPCKAGNSVDRRSLPATPLPRRVVATRREACCLSSLRITSGLAARKCLARARASRSIARPRSGSCTLPGR